ncbi:unnamed protein product [Calicophoron daubneyi]|uniref:Tubulin epsilon and delta complex protein 1 domain-containing protein n=1 Tax=Calicophoron daubneyi TaxID=300641 RepID=A0AAV2TPI1_CALDB
MGSAVINIKTCIQLFAKLLKCAGFSNFLAEDFRLAKFNDSRGYEPMLHLLYELLYFSEYNCIDEVCLEGYRRFSAGDVRNYCYNQLLKLGYPCLPSSEYIEFSSRDLLLACAWVFSDREIMHKIENILIENTRRTVNPGKYPGPSFEQPGLSKSSLLKGLDHGVASNSVTNNCNRLLWLTGQLRMQLKQLYQLRLSVLNLQDRFRARSPELKLSPLEYLLCDDADAVRKSIKQVEQLNDHLEAIHSWYLNSGKFWQWMRSVADSTDWNQPTSLPSDGFTKLSDVHKSLSDALLKYSLLLDRFTSKIPGGLLSEVDECTLDALILGIDEDIHYFCAHLQATPSTSLIRAPLEYRYHTEKSRPSDRSSVHSEPVNTDVPLDAECQKLASLLNTVKKKNELQKSKLGAELQHFSENSVPGILFLYDNDTRTP